MIAQFGQALVLSYETDLKISDMDGLRKVPTNVPNQDMLAKYLGYPLTKVPDPFGKFESFGHHNTAMLRQFLDGA